MVFSPFLRSDIQGIGAGIATAFAKYSPKDKNAPHIILVGRSQQGADDVIAEMKKVNSAGQYEFVKGDLSLMKGVRSVANEVTSKVDKINYLCMSAGILTLKAQDDTEEGLDKKASLHFYSRLTHLSSSKLTCRFLLGNLLMPKVEKAAETGEDARVLSVLAAGHGGAIDVNNLNLSNAGLKRKADSATTYNDLMIEVRP
jgi:NAD(P)-dependent dehydrogenase (short-subunit alcohol dehydrogenase family)